MRKKYSLVETLLHKLTEYLHTVNRLEGASNGFAGVNIGVLFVFLTENLWIKGRFNQCEIFLKYEIRLTFQFELLIFTEMYTIFDFYATNQNDIKGIRSHVWSCSNDNIKVKNKVNY